MISYNARTVAICVAAVGIFFLFPIGCRKQPYSADTRQGLAPSGGPAPRTRAHASSAPQKETLTLSPGQYKFFVIEAKPEWENFNLSVYFRAQGGSHNDVEAFLLDEIGFENWKNGNAFLQYYQSGKVTVDKFSKVLGPGKYILVSSRIECLRSPTRPSSWS
jgi:hypothetical protein